MSKMKWKAQNELNNKILSDAKDMKIIELKESCTQSIYDGFISSINNYEFGLNEHDQQNLNQEYTLVVSGDNFGLPIRWATKNNGVVELTEEEFRLVVSESRLFRLSQQEKYWKLEKQVIASSTIEEIERIRWDAI